MPTLPLESRFLISDHQSRTWFVCCQKHWQQFNDKQNSLSFRHLTVLFLCPKYVLNLDHIYKTNVSQHMRFWYFSHFGQVCTNVQTCQSLHYLHIQSVDVNEDSDQNLDL